MHTKGTSDLYEGIVSLDDGVFCIGEKLNFMEKLLKLFGL
ncbi:hypothetical protein RUMLAC_00381 [[Ruminococcus] lactaris ATCC 29176]|uniref:Uncharacterized protein n=1 Tax=[Ruminococcus] lactaris ATCC 29176 TaxID=471875 RepID=B5CLQ7_9FIRM|nr:hypothetical protein RUMLAC_00381 [[Ruminococcus] lactaris ATCC 29176]